MSFTIDQLLSPATPQEWLATLLANAVSLGLPTTSWQPGDPERTILAIDSFALNYEDCVTSIIAQGGFLDFAATGTVTFTNVDGTATIVPVTPDPSDASVNPTAALGWLDTLANSVYNVRRNLLTFAGGPMAIVNTSVATYGPFASGTYHVSNPYSGATYSNTTTLTILPSSTIGTVSACVSSGGVIKITTASAHGISSGATVFVLGVTGISPLAQPTAWIVDVTNSTQFTLRGSTFGGSYTGGGTVYAPSLAMFIADVGGTGSNSIDAGGTPNVHTVTQAVTALVGVSVDNLAPFLGSNIETNIALAARCRLKLQSLSLGGPKGAYSYAALSAQQLAPGLDPPQSVASAITRNALFVDKTSGYVYEWIANAAGAPSGPDVTAVAAVVEAYAVPNSVIAFTNAATPNTISAALDVYVPVTFNNSSTVALFQNAISTLFAVTPIGGLTDPNGSYTNVLPFDDVLGAVYTAGAAAKVPISNATLTLNGGTANIPLAFGSIQAEVATLLPNPPTVNLHSV